MENKISVVVQNSNKNSNELEKVYILQNGISIKSFLYDNLDLEENLMKKIFVNKREADISMILKTGDVVDLILK